MPVLRSSAGPRRQTRLRPALAGARVTKAFERLARQRALQTLVRGALGPFARRLLKDAMPARAAAELPEEVWSSLAASIALESPGFAVPLAQELHDRLSWDKEPAELDAWWDLVREKPLEALWMAALSENRAVRKEFAENTKGHSYKGYIPAGPPPIPKD